MEICTYSHHAPGMCHSLVQHIVYVAQVQRALLPSLGGHANASFDEVVARIARAKVP